MLTLLVILAVYSLCVTAALVLARRPDHAANLSRAILDELKSKAISDEKRVETMTEVAKIFKDLSPWYERSVSALGVFAFLGMAVASAVQTVNATRAEDTVEQLQAEKTMLREEFVRAERVIDGVARGMLSLGWVGSEQDAATKELMLFRLQQLRLQDSGPDAVRMSYEIALALGDFKTAVEILEGNIELLQHSNPVDLVALAEYYYLTGADSRSLELVRTARTQGSGLPRAVRLRLLTLEDALDKTDSLADSRVQELAVLLRLERQRAVSVLTQRKRDLAEGRVILLAPPSAESAEDLRIRDLAN